MPKKPKPSNHVTEASGVALAAYLLNANMLRLLEEKGAFTRSDVDALLLGILQILERDHAATDPAAHTARQLLVPLAVERGLPLRSPN